MRERIELHPWTPWALRLFDRVPLPAGVVGIGIALAVFAVYLVWTTVLGNGPGRLKDVPFEGAWAAELIQDLFIGFTLAIQAHSVRGALRDFEALAPVLRGDAAQRAALREMITTYRPGLLWAVGLFGGIGTIWVIQQDRALLGENLPEMGWSHPSMLWLAGRNFVNWWVVSRAIALEITLGVAFSRLGDHLASIDLLDRAPLAPFGNRALRNVLLWMLLTAFLSLTYVGEGWAGQGMPLALGLLGAFALTAFVLPLLGAHRQIRRQKSAELARLRDAIAAAREQVLEKHAGELTGGRLADLVAYETRIAAAREWPIDATTLLRLGLYLAFGFGSWIGAALVERALDTALR